MTPQEYADNIVRHGTHGYRTEPSEAVASMTRMARQTMPAEIVAKADGQPPKAARRALFWTRVGLALSRVAGIEPTSELRDLAATLGVEVES